MDLATIGGLLLAALAILGGQALEGGHIGSIVQPTAFIIVIGGTIGAVAVQFPGFALKAAMVDLMKVFKTSSHNNGNVLTTIVALSQRARREGLISMESEIEKVEDPFMRKAIGMAVDGTEAGALRGALEIELGLEEESGEMSSKVFEAAGGYSPTVGILGAVLGLIHVMENLSNPSKLGGGIAVAFVATVYGVGAANILFLPMAGKLKLRHREHTIMMELVIEGVCAIVQGENPRVTERKLAAYVRERNEGETREVASLAAARA